MVDVVEVEPRDRLREQVVERRRRLLDLLAEARVVRLERPRDEGAEAVHLVLQLPDVRMCLRAPRASRRARTSSSRALVDMPSLWASRMTPSHRTVFVFLGAMIVRTRSTSTSPPPPGSESRPEVAQPRERLRDGQLRAARDVLDLGRRERVQVDLVARLDAREEVPSYHSMPRSGWWPPCISTAVPPSASVSSIFLWITGLGAARSPRGYRRGDGRRRRSRSP